MNAQIKDSSGRQLLTISIRFDHQLLADFLFSRNGLPRYLYHLLAALMLCVCCCGIQLSWNLYFADLPFYPALLYAAFCGSRHPLVPALLQALLCGFLLDAGYFQPLGSHPLLLLATAAACHLLCAGREPRRRHFIRCTLLCASVATLVYLGGKMLLRLPATPSLTGEWLCHQLLLPWLFHTLAAFPALFALLDRLDRFFDE